MRVAIITPYHREDDLTLHRCQMSVANQTHESTHIWVSDGVRKGSDFGEYGHEQHVSLPVAHADYGDTPRLIGTLTAYQQGFDAVCWLDADNWLEPDHVEKLLKIADREVVSVVTATRNLRRPDGTLLSVCTESDGQTFCDTNCYLIMRDAIPAVAMTWGFKPPGYGVVGDRFVWEKVTATYPDRGHCDIPTVNYTTKIAAHYLAAGETPPSDARVIMQAPGQRLPVSVLYSTLKNA